MSQIWEPLDKSFDKIFQFGNQNWICNLVFFVSVLVDNFENSGSILLVNFFLEYFVLVFNELNILNLLVILLFHLSLQELNHLEHVQVGKVGSINKKRGTVFILEFNWVCYCDLRHVPLVFLLAVGFLKLN